jgi:hypothetical protein
MAVEIDPAMVAAARQTLSDWINQRTADPALRTTADSYDEWQVEAHDEFLIFSSPGGYTNQLYLIGDGVVKPFSYAWDTVESAAEAARAERDGTAPPPAPPAPPVW